MLGIRRARVHGPLLAGFLGTAMLLCGVGVAVVGLVDAAIDDGARAVASRHAGADLALRVSLDLPQDPAGPDAEGQDAQVRAAMAHSLTDLSAPYSVDRTVAGEAPLTVPGPDGAGPERLVTVVSIPDLAARADLVAGSWAEDDDDVVVQADAADELGLSPGEQVTVGGARLRVAGTWRAHDPLDPRWLGDTQVATGSADGQFGPVVVAESRWADVGAEPRARWVVVPDLHDVTAADLDTVARARDRLGLAWRGQVEDVDSLEVDGDLPEVAHEVALRTDGLRAVEPVVLLLLAAVGLVTLAALARLFASTHAQELALLWARGASSGGLARSAALETSVAAAVGGTVGALAAGITVVLGSGASQPATTAGAAVVAVAAVALSGAALTAVQVHRATGRTSHAWRGPSGRAGRLVGPGLVALVAAAAALAVWQLRAYGSPVTVDTFGRPAVDPVAVAAPAGLLVAVVLLGLVLFPVVAARAERRSHTDDVRRLLAARHLSRRLVPVTAPVLVVAIAAGTVITAAAYAGTWGDSFDTTRQLRAGADVRVSTTGSGPDAATLDAVAGAAGVRALAPVAIQLGGDIGSVVAVTPAALGSLAQGFSDDAERQKAVAALSSQGSAPELSAGAERVEVVLEAAGLAGRPRVTVLVADAAGALRELPLRADRRATSGTLSYSARLPPDASGVAGPRTIAAVDLGVEWRQPEAHERPRVGLVEIRTTGPDGPVTVDEESWTAQVPGSSEELPLVPGRAPSGDVAVDPEVRKVRLTPSYAPGSPDGPAVPLVLSAATAHDLDLGVGDPLTLSLDGTYQQLQAQVSRVVAAVPGAPDEAAALVDLRVVEQALLRGQAVVPPPTDLWVSTEDPATTITDLRRLLPANSRIDTAQDADGRTVLATAVQAWWLGAAGCGLLALLTIGTVARGQLRSRRGDVAVLRALGMSVRDQQLLRGRELAWTVVFALVVGLVAGVSVAFLVVPQLARAAVPEPYPTIATGLGVDATGLLAGAVLLVGALAVSVAAYAWRVGVEARLASGPVGER